jgi:predicted MPP superfamily phosphohydrolase/drug/metabolite transporter superfamily protein YnfA
MNYMAIIIFIVVAALVEWGAFTAFRGWVKGKSVWFWVYCVITVLSYAFLASFNFAPRGLRYPLLNAFGIIFFGKLLATLVLAIWLGLNEVRSLISSPENTVSESRRSFIKKGSAVVGLVPVGLMSWGIFRTAGNFKVHTVKLTLKGMPDAFKGFKIVQVSDIHTGSFFSHDRMEEAVSEILEQNADIVVFSGDLVNNRTDECYEYMDILAKIQAPLGVYSTLGNHDYGDYEGWATKEEKTQNFQEMLDVHKKLGWNLMMNEHKIFERNGEKIALLGVENWGANLRFPKYGRMNLAYPGTEDVPVKILISHDPSHWEAEVLKDYPEIQLMMAGHTHGFQFGVEIPGIKWSPSQWVYKQWAGLYENSGRYLYVNRGLGCIGYMGRVGIRPEITVFELS